MVSKTSVSVFDKLSQNAKISLRISKSISSQLFSSEVMPVELFLGLLLNRNSLFSRTIVSMNLDIDNIVSQLIGDIRLEIDNKSKVPQEIDFNLDTAEILRDAYLIARRFSHVYVGTEHIGLSILGNIELPFVKVLESLGLTYSIFEKALMQYAAYPLGLLAKPDIPFPVSQEGSVLNMYGTDITSDARNGRFDPIIGRDEEIEKIINILSRRKKNNVLIVGESGVGKTALVQGLAQRIVSGLVPESLKECKIISIDVASIIAGSKMRGDIEEKMSSIVKEISLMPNTIVFFDEIHNILSTGIPGSQSDFVSVLKPALTEGNFRVVGTTTNSEYSKYLEDDNAFVRRFQSVLVLEPSMIDTVAILKRLKPVLEGHHGVKIDKTAIEAAVTLSDRYVSDRFLPDKAIDLLDEASALQRLSIEKQFSSISDLRNKYTELEKEKEALVNIQGDLLSAQNLREQQNELLKEINAIEKKRKNMKKMKEVLVNDDTVRLVVSKWTGIPITTIGGKEKSSLINLESILNRYVVGQKEASVLVSNAIKRARVGISAEDRPWASFLFLGPTGVGKTELAKVLTKQLFGDEDRLIQIDMSELMEMHSVSKLIGSPPGYVGYKEGGQLTEKIRQNPHSVVLFDEIEKAHPDVLNVLLQILEYGHLTDGKGRKVNFKNAVIILTSNIGAEEISKDKVLGFRNKNSINIDTQQEEQAYSVMKEQLMKQLKNTLRPELLNRLDDIVIFRSLNQNDASKIIDLLLQELNNRLKNLDISVDITKDLKDYILQLGFSKEYGARPLKRALQDIVENEIANIMLQNEEDLPKKLILDFQDNKVIQL